MLPTLLCKSLLGAALVRSELVPDPNWTRPNITIPRQERVRLASEALDTTAKMLDSNLILADSSSTPLSNTARLFTQLAVFDEITMQSDFKKIVQRYFDIRGDCGSGNLTMQTKLYNTVANELPASYKISPMADISFVFDCSDNLTSGFDLVLIALQNLSMDYALVETFDEMYQVTLRPDWRCMADEMEAVIKRFNSSSYRISCPDKPGDAAIEYLNGITGGGPSIFLDSKTSLSQGMNSFDEVIIRESAFQAVSALELWNVFEPTERDAGPGEFLFSLSRASQRLGSLAEIQAYLHAYISDQYNTLLDNITSADPSYNDWNKTESTHMDMWKRLSISYTLLAGIGMPEIISKTRGESEVPVGRIAGGTIGGVVIICASASFTIVVDVETNSSNLRITPFPNHKQLVTTNNAPRDWQIKDRSGLNRTGAEGDGSEALDAAPRPGSQRYPSPATFAPVQEPAPEEANRPDGERDQDSGWRPSGAHRLLPPAYEDAM
ncbi:hypothetical protein VNI00_015202 [Paramarasmius palmivorus]|uniref:Uncharacterized protein n=1 Tax=Paramarasmius palmivorus TaxID=297713 RepID=A0AAW0BLE9_9AGAR